MFTGKVKDVRRELHGSSAIGEAQLAGLDGHAAADHQGRPDDVKARIFVSGSRSALPAMPATISTSNRSRRPWRDRRDWASASPC